MNHLSDTQRIRATGSASADRREFLVGLTALLVTGSPGRPWPTPHSNPIDRGELEPWLVGLAGNHRQFFDVATLVDGTPLRRVGTFLNVYQSVYRLGADKVNAVVGCHSRALPLVLDDTAWERYRLGEWSGATDPVTAKPATRNPFIAEAPGQPFPVVGHLQQQGVRFLACLQTLGRLAGDLGRRDGEPADVVRAALLDAVLPDVVAVSAMIVAANQAQEAGLAYVYIG